jgi:hypothetical protein
MQVVFEDQLKADRALLEEELSIREQAIKQRVADMMIETLARLQVCDSLRQDSELLPK